MSRRASLSGDDGNTVRLRSRGVLVLEAPAREVSRSIYEGARDLVRDIATAKAQLTSRNHAKSSSAASTEPSRGSLGLVSCVGVLHVIRPRPADAPKIADLAHGGDFAQHRVHL
jgi:hypothetical protein